VALMLSRRSILGGLLAAPVVIKAGVLMRCAPTEIIRPAFLTPPLHIVFPHIRYASGDTVHVTWQTPRGERMIDRRTCLRSTIGYDEDFTPQNLVPA
jgi:hypothetical protein